MIKEVRMMNCQSWKDGCFSMATDRANIIVADNGTGKSVFIKMLKITACPKYFSREERTALIRWGAEYAQIVFILDDGAAAATRVYPGYVLYLYRRPENKFWEKSYEPFEEMLHGVGLLADVKNRFIANIIDTDQELLLINDNLKSNYNLMQLLIFCEDLENVRSRVSEEKKRMVVHGKELANRLGSIKYQISECKYTDVAYTERKIEELRIVKEWLYAFIDIFEQIEMISQQAEASKDYDEMFKVLNVLESLEEIDLELLAVQPEPCVSDDWLLLLETAEDALLALNDVSAVKSYDSLLDRELEVLEGLELLDLEMLVVYPEPAVCDAEIDLLESLSEISAAVSEFRSELCFQNKVLNKIRQLEQDFRKSGKKVDCPVYGKVIFNGKECVPDCQ